MFEKIDEPIAATVSGDGTVVVGITEEGAAKLEAPAAVDVTAEKTAEPSAPAPVAPDTGKFGLWAFAGITVDNEKNTVTVAIDDPLPDDDAVFIRTSIPKAAQIITRKVAGTLLATGPEMKFFESP